MMRHFTTAALLIALALPASATTTYHWLPMLDLCFAYNDDPLCGGMALTDATTADECDDSQTVSQYFNRVPLFRWCVEYWVNAMEWEGETVSHVTSAGLAPDYMCDGLMQAAATEAALLFTPLDQEERGVITYFTFAGFCWGADLSSSGHHTPHGYHTGTEVNDLWLAGVASDCKWAVQ